MSVPWRKRLLVAAVAALVAAPLAVAVARLVAGAPVAALAWAAARAATAATSRRFRHGTAQPSTPIER